MPRLTYNISFSQTHWLCLKWNDECRCSYCRRVSLCIPSASLVLVNLSRRIYIVCHECLYLCSNCFCSLTFNFLRTAYCRTKFFDVQACTYLDFSPASNIFFFFFSQQSEDSVKNVSIASTFRCLGVWCCG